MVATGRWELIDGRTVELRDHYEVNEHDEHNQPTGNKTTLRMPVVVVFDEEGIERCWFDHPTLKAAHFQISNWFGVKEERLV